jgi:hypothetical protein
MFIIGYSSWTSDLLGNRVESSHVPAASLLSCHRHGALLLEMASGRLACADSSRRSDFDSNTWRICHHQLQTYVHSAN